MSPELPKHHEYGRPRDAAELVALKDVLAPIFNITREMVDRYALIAGEANFRAIHVNGRLAGGLVLLPMGQYFGGKAVPMMGVALVGVAPEHRACGTATLLMHEAVREMHREGWPISTLYPATLSLYRRAGYELAGSRSEIQINLRALRAPTSPCEIRPAVESDFEALERMHKARAAASAGNLERGSFLWKRVFTQRGEPARGFVAVNPRTHAVEGFTYFLQKPSEHAAYLLQLTDLCAITPEATQSLLALLISHRTMADVAIWMGSAADQFLRNIPERHFKVTLGDHWMVRVCDVSAALTARGYPRGLHAEIHLDVHDDLILANNGKFVLEANDGKPQVSAGGRGDIQIDIRGLAALFTGFATARELIMDGRLSVASHAKSPERSLDEITAAFAGPAPWMTDGF